MKCIYSGRFPAPLLTHTKKKFRGTKLSPPNSQCWIKSPVLESWKICSHFGKLHFMETFWPQRDLHSKTVQHSAPVIWSWNPKQLCYGRCPVCGNADSIMTATALCNSVHIIASNSCNKPSEWVLLVSIYDEERDIRSKSSFGCHIAQSVQSWVTPHLSDLRVCPHNLPPCPQPATFQSVCDQIELPPFR